MRCLECGEKLIRNASGPGRPAVFCSAACRQRAYRRRGGRASGTTGAERRRRARRQSAPHLHTRDVGARIYPLQANIAEVLEGYEHDVEQRIWSVLLRFDGIGDHSRTLRTVLLRARKGAGWTQAYVAYQMDWSGAKVSRMETGRNRISVNDMRVLLQYVYKVTDPTLIERVVDLTRRVRQQRRT